MCGGGLDPAGDSAELPASLAEGCDAGGRGEGERDPRLRSTVWPPGSGGCKNLSLSKSKSNFHSSSWIFFLRLEAIRPGPAAGPPHERPHHPGPPWPRGLQAALQSLASAAPAAGPSLAPCPTHPRLPLRAAQVPTASWFLRLLIYCRPLPTGTPDTCGQGLFTGSAFHGA